TLGSIAGDAVLIRYDGAGNQLWRRDISIDYGSGSGTAQNFELSVDPAGNVFAYTEIIYSASPFGGSARQRVALTKFDADGVQGWTRELVNGRYVRLGGVAADELGNVYITGSANAPLAGHVIGLEGYEGFVAKYDADGNQQWLRRIGNAASQFAQHARDLTVDGLGNVYVAGSTGLVLGQQSFGGSDMYLAKFDSDGNQFWIHQFGTSSAEDSAHVQADGLGNVFVAGRTKGDFGGPHSGGGDDIFLAKFFDGPTIDGDLNGDGVVDGLDFLAWQRGQSPTPHSAADLDQWKAMFPAASPMLEGDFDNNGVVDGADFLLWQRGQSPNQFNSASDLAQWQANHGRVAGDATAASVPEPGTLTAAWLIAGCIALVRNSRGIVRRTRTARLHN
ncbi:MAG TPA: SBBP repeat-containing protein, partial [Lacipirellulaceae bacterium]|nr:SBBP repeat-containing protein [Lacipirellulaceae bacterium]